MKSKKKNILDTKTQYYIVDQNGSDIKGDKVIKGQK